MMAGKITLPQGGDRARLQAILSADEFADLEKTAAVVKNAIGTKSDINVGSRTAPLLAEQQDLASQMPTSILSDLFRGHPFMAAGKFAGRLGERLAEGKTEAVNAKIAETLASTDPAQVGLVKALLERARLDELTRKSGRMNALTYGGLANPGFNVIAGYGANR